MVGGMKKNMKNKFTDPEINVCMFEREAVEAAGPSDPSTQNHTAAQDLTNQFQQVLMGKGGGTVTTVKLESIMGFKN